MILKVLFWVIGSMEMLLIEVGKVIGRIDLGGKS